ncbi:MAG: hypothetical protein EOP00_21545 [Pedobacter sp.]|nr:MAG: hypothetical protein EOP00_21545 [Pedobacter sp.]
MKTSNKILIAFAAALILIPVLGMVIVSATQYKTGTYTVDRFQAPDQSDKTFVAKSAGKTAIKINEPFTQVDIEDAKGASIELHLNTDKSFGAKIPDNLKETFDFKVTNGVLKISIKEGAVIDEYRNRAIIMLYAPNLLSLKGNKVNNLHLVTLIDEFNIDLKDCTYFSLSRGEITSTTVVNGDTTDHQAFDQTAIKNLKLNLDHTEFNLADLNINSLDITASNNSVVNINEEGSEDRKALNTSQLNKLKAIFQIRQS